MMKFGQKEVTTKDFYGQREIWADDDDCYHDDEPIEWFKKYRKRKAQKASIKEELLPTTWYLNRVKDWCISEDE